MRRIIVGVFLAVAAFAAQAVCSPEKLKVATSVPLQLGQMAEVTEEGGELVVRWGPEFDSLTSAQQRRLITTFADSDACLTGKPRDIEFYRSGKMVGKASPRTGITFR